MITALAFLFSFPSASVPLVSKILSDSHCSTLSYYTPNQSSSNSIALIDSLSTQLPNPGFEQSTKASAQKAGYAFDYYPANATTVDFFLNLPRMNYKIVILRTHGGMAFLTTSELYSQQRMVMDQLLDRVGAVDVNGTVYFGLYPKSVTELMCGRFQGTLILAMGCGASGTVDLANAFIGMGARGLIGWDNRVTISRSDSAYQVVIQNLLEHESIASSVRSASLEVGSDPVYGASLHYYPETQGQFSL